MMNLMRGTCFFLLICLVLAGCAATRREEIPQVIPGPVPAAGTEQAEISEDGIRASLIRDGMLLESPGELSGPVKRIPAFSRVLIIGYEELGADEAYFSVVHGDDRGYLATGNFAMDSTLAAFIEAERAYMYALNLEALERIHRYQEELEREEAWVRSVITDVRALPSPLAPVLDSLDRGSVVFPQEERDGWYRVLYRGPFIDYEDLSYDYLAGVVSAYGDPHDLTAAYREGWIEKGMLSERELERLTDDEKRRHIYIEENPDLFPIIKEAIMNGEIMIGMTRDMVVASWGPAEEIERSTSLFDDREQWVYGDTFLYFEKGILNAWQNFDE